MAAGDADFAAVLHALGDPVRLELVRRMASNGEERCLPTDLDVPKSTLSNHWRILREAGITDMRPQGRSRWMSLRRQELQQRYPGLIEVVLRHGTEGRSHGNGGSAGPNPVT